MNSFRDTSIQHKLTAIIMLTSSVVLLLSSAVFVFNDLISFRSSLIEKLTTLAEVIGITSASAIVFSSPEAAEETLSALEAEPHMIFACIYNKEGQVFATYPFDLAGEDLLIIESKGGDFRYKESSLEPKMATGDDYNFRKDYLDLFRPIIFDGDVLGTIYIRSGLLELYSRLKLYCGVVVIVITVLILVAYLLSSKLQRVISGPILHLKRTMKTVSQEKKYSLRAEKQSNDELGLLIDGFNEMLAQIQKEMAERKQAEEAFRESEEKYRTILESIEDAYFEVDLAGNYIFFNDSLNRILGYSPDELSGANSRQHMDKENADKLHQASQKVYGAGKSDRAFACEIIRKDGVKRQIETSLSLVGDAEGHRTGFRGVARDITEQKELEIQLSHAQKLKSIGQLAAGIAHEINTPTQYVGDNTRFFQDSFSGINQVLGKYEELLNAVKAGEIGNDLVSGVEAIVEKVDVEYLKKEIPLAIRQSIDGLDRVASIVRAMKDFSHPGVEEKISIDINKAIQNTITVARNEWKYVAEMEIAFDSTLPLVPCLPGEFNQVILNIIINASHAIRDVVGGGSEKKGIIAVNTHNLGSEVEIRIRDTGGGIPKKIRSRIFDPFFTTKAVGRGTGQGLAISHSIITEKHGGIIRFETKDGRGSTFIIRLPVENDPGQREKKDEETNPFCG